MCNQIKQYSANDWTILIFINKIVDELATGY